LAFLRQCHRDAPFLFFNGNTFADIGRRLTAALLADLPPARLRQATSAVAHFVAGVLDWESMSGIVLGLMIAASFAPGDRVMTLRGTSHGVVVRLLDDGRMVWRADGGNLELICLPESMSLEE
jgi:hypothetical protein